VFKDACVNAKHFSLPETFDGLVSIDKMALRLGRLVLEWVTAECVSQFRM